MKHNKLILTILLVTSVLAVGCGTTEPVVTEEVETIVEETEPTVKEDDSLTSEAEEITESEVTITEELNTQLYVVKAADILKLDQEGAGGISPVEVGAYLTVTGKTSNNWYQVQWGNTKGYLPADVLSTENPHPAPATDPSEVLPNGMTQEEFDEKVQQAISGLDESIVGPDASGMKDLGIAPSYE